MAKLRKPKYHLAEVGKAFSSLIFPRVWQQAVMTATQYSHRQEGKESIYLLWQWGHTFRGISTYSPPATHTKQSVPLPLSLEVVLHDGISLTVHCWHCFESLTAGAMPRCSARQWTHRKRQLQLLTQRGCLCVCPSKWLWSMVRDGKLLLVSVLSVPSTCAQAVWAQDIP